MDIGGDSHMSLLYKINYYNISHVLISKKTYTFFRKLRDFQSNADNGKYLTYIEVSSVYHQVIDPS